MDERHEGLMDLVEQAFLLGLGAASMTKEKVDRTVDELIARGRLSREEGCRVARQMEKRGREEREALKGSLLDEMGRMLSSAAFATKGDVRRLEAEIAELRGRLDMGPMSSVAEEAPGREVPEPGTAPELTDTER